MKVVLILLVFTMTGCVTTQLGSVPVTDEEFTQSIETIRQNHSDVALYENFFWRGYPAKVGDFDSLTEQWGEPDKVEKQWGLKALGVILHTAIVATQGMAWGVYFAVEGLFLLPNETNTWSKGNYEIEAITSESGLFAYQKKLTRWAWKEKDAESKLASTKCIGMC